MRKFLPMMMLIWIFPVPFCRAQEVLSWEDCLREAAKNHPDLVAAREEIIQSRSLKTTAASGLYPQIDADVHFSTAQSDTSGHSKSSSFGISASQLLFDGFKTINNTYTASENIKASRESFRFTSAEVRWRLRQAFIDVLKAQALEKLTRDIQKIRRENLQLITLRYESGTEHRGALLTAQAQLASAEFDIHQAERSLVSARHSLIKELGRRDFSPVLVQGALDVAVDFEEAPDFEALAVQHPNLLKSVAQKNAAAYEINAARGNFLPTLSLDGNAGRAAAGWSPRNDESDVGLRISLPLFRGGANKAELDRSRSVYRQLTANERGTKDAIVVSLIENWNALHDAVETIGVEQKFLAATQERSKIAEAQYSVGIISYDNWTIIEDDLVRQKKSFLNAQIEALRAQADWIQAKGETLEYENQ